MRLEYKPKPLILGFKAYKAVENYASTVTSLAVPSQIPCFVQ